MELAGLSCAVSFAKVCLPLASLYMFICFETIWKHNYASSSYVWQGYYVSTMPVPMSQTNLDSSAVGGARYTHVVEETSCDCLESFISLGFIYINISYFYSLYVIVSRV